MARSVIKSIMQLSRADTEPEKLFLEDLKRAIEVRAMGNARKPSTYYKPSSLKCIRNMYYYRTGAECKDSVYTYQSVGITTSGSNIHLWLQLAVNDMSILGMPCQYLDVGDYIRDRHVEDKLSDITVIEKSGPETKLHSNRFNMNFMCDGLIEYRGKLYILEIKTETASKWYERTGVDPAHYDQATAYSLTLGINDVIFIYVNRDVLDLKAFLFSVTPTMRDNLRQKIDNCEKYVAEKVVPPKPEEFDRKKGPCRYCAYVTQCKND